MWLLKFPCVTATRYFRFSVRLISSLVVVFPLLPVIARIGIPSCRRVACGQFLQCFQRIGYDEIVRLFRRGHSVRYRRVVYDRRRCSRSDRRRRIAVAVERFPVQRKENSSRDDLPAIGRDAREFAI